MSSDGAPACDAAAEDYGAPWPITELAIEALDNYGFPLGQLFIAAVYGFYRRITLINMMNFLIKCTTWLYIYKMLKNVYKTSRERMKQKQQELEDLQLQIKIVNTKLCVRESEFSERSEQLRRAKERQRAVQARVRGRIAADRALRRALRAAPWGDEPDHTAHDTPEQERDFTIAMLKEMKSSEQVAIPKRQPDKMECGEPLPREEIPTPENSVYSSLSDGEAKDCRVKIVKITNVYKIAYLKHFIKQKRLRRANQQALLKKKIESVKKLLESWQKSLDKVINSKILSDTTPVDLASQEAMGDYSKPNLRESSDSDSDLKTSGTDTNNEDDWAQNPYKTYGYTYDDKLDSGATKEMYEGSYNHYNIDMRYQSHMCNCVPREPNALFILPEETSSQVAIEEIKDDDDDDTDCRDLVAI